jgi:hypothetical protein
MMTNKSRQICVPFQIVVLAGRIFPRRPFLRLQASVGQGMRQAALTKRKTDNGSLPVPPDILKPSDDPRDPRLSRLSLLELWEAQKQEVYSNILARICCTGKAD